VGPPPAPPAPVLLSPDGPITTATPTYQWNAVPGATSYRLEVGHGGPVIIREMTAAEAGCATGTGICQITLPNPVIGSAVWWLQARNAGGSGPWSSKAFQAATAMS